MKTLSGMMAAGALLALSVVAPAAPVRYDITFDADYGPSGTGSFYYDGATSLLSNLTWDFGWGYDDDGNYVHFAGGVDDSRYDWSAPHPEGSTRSRYMFEIMTLYDTHPDDCRWDCFMYFNTEAEWVYGEIPSQVFVVSTLYSSGDRYRGYEANSPGDFSWGSFSTTGSCDPTTRTRLSLRGEVTFSIPSADAPWGYLPAGSPVDTSLRYDGCSVPPGGGEFAIPGDLSGSLAMSFDGFLLGTQDDFFFYDEYPYSPQASFDVNQNLSGIHFLWTPNADDWLYVGDWGPGGLNFEGYFNNELALAGTLLAVPEPGKLALLGLGLAGIGFARRRKA